MNLDNDSLIELMERMRTMLLDSATIALLDVPKEVNRHLLNRLEKNTDKVNVILQIQIIEMFKREPDHLRTQRGLTQLINSTISNRRTAQIH